MGSDGRSMQVVLESDNPNLAAAREELDLPDVNKMAIAHAAKCGVANPHLNDLFSGPVLIDAEGKSYELFLQEQAARPPAPGEKQAQFKGVRYVIEKKVISGL